VQEELAYYKAQYETLEVELQEFQASSKELEAELERDVEESEKRERKLQEKAERLGFEVEEWKVCGPSAAGPATLMLTMITDQVQAKQDRGQQCTECASKGNHSSTRRATIASNEVARHRGAERRLRAPGAPPNLVAGRCRVQIQRFDRAGGHDGGRNEDWRTGARSVEDRDPTVTGRAVRSADRVGDCAGEATSRGSDH